LGHKIIILAKVSLKKNGQFLFPGIAQTRLA